MSRLFISAAHKSSGKTTLSIGLAMSLVRRGIEVQAFKKGPDYIDPLWLSKASGRPAYNLDFNTQTADEILATYASRQSRFGINIIEGNKGLHDGVDVGGSDSSAALAKLLCAPVVLIIDVTSMTRGIAPLLMGYGLFDPAVDLRGVILNQVAGARQESKLRAAIEAYTGLSVLGALPRSPAIIVKERHLGLTTPGDAEGAEARIERIRHEIDAHVDVEAVVGIACSADRLLPVTLPSRRRHCDVSIGVAMDAAFCFYYQDDLETLERAGERLVPFSPLSDPCLPDVDGLLIGGGFPETHIARLAANASMRADLRQVAAAGMPVHAECGGLMYLCRSITFGGETGAMVGVIPADAVMPHRPHGRGRGGVAPNGDGPAATIPAHEFHYARLENLAEGLHFAWRMRRGEGIDGRHDGIVVNNVAASFTHFRDTSKHHWAWEFVETVRRNKTSSRAGAPGANLIGA